MPKRLTALGFAFRRFAVPGRVGARVFGLNIGCRYSTPVRKRPLHPTRSQFKPEASQTQAPVTPATEPERRAGGSLTGWSREALVGVGYPSSRHRVSSEPCPVDPGACIRRRATPRRGPAVRADDSLSSVPDTPSSCPRHTGSASEIRRRPDARTRGPDRPCQGLPCRRRSAATLPAETLPASSRSSENRLRLGWGEPRQAPSRPPGHSRPIRPVRPLDRQTLPAAS